MFNYNEQVQAYESDCVNLPQAVKDKLRDQREALVIPEEALIKRGDKNFVFVADQADGKLTAREQEITIGSRRPGDIEVLGGLEQGDKIVTHGTLKLINGAEITIKAEEQGDTPVGDLLKQEARN